MNKDIEKKLIITIDGPSGAGKSTIARMLSKALGYVYIDTGAMYRGIAYAFMNRRQEAEIDEFLEHLSIRFNFTDGTRVFLEDRDISDEIRTPEVTSLASSLSQKSPVRQYLTKIQREIGRDGGVVLEGRDTGSIVFPDADIKFYLDADPEERARRRHLEFKSKGIDTGLTEVKKDMSQRDRNDSERSIAPLIIPEGAVYIDTTGIDIQGVIGVLLKHVREKG
ncbi:MAG: Cytidylate kinase [Syntrophorhabdus sp. PtaU1.Bin058]|nr:MAG: Cytidylate kinase [Syntrophorhabdus sp. PtaU1.Bin058]